MLVVGALPLHGQTETKTIITPDAAVQVAIDSSRSLGGCENIVMEAYMERQRAIEAAAPDADEQRRAVTAWRGAMLKRCIARVDIENAPRFDLLNLMGTASRAGQPDVVRNVVTFLLSQTPPDSHAHAVLNIIMYRSGVIPWDADNTGFPDDEQLVLMLDTAGSRHDAVRLKGYQMLTRYFDDPVRTRVLDSARAIVHRLPAGQRARHAMEIDQLYEDLVGLAAIHGRFHDVPGVLVEGRRMMNSTSRPPYYYLYGKVAPLTGTQAAPLSPDYWLNAGADSGKTYHYNNRITVIEFTTPWCGVCVQGYPILVDLAAKYAGVVRPLLLTYLEGMTGIPPQPSTEAELAHKYDYWVNKHGITFPILAAEKAEDDSSADTGKNHPMLRQFKFAGLPTYVVIDGEGTIRYIGSGGAPRLEWELTSVVERLVSQLQTGQSRTP